MRKPGRTDGSDVIEGYRQYLSEGRARMARLLGAEVEVEARGAHVTTKSGRELLDCSGYGVFLTGHSHPRVVDAVCRQVQRKALATRVLAEPEVVAAAERLCSVAPPGMARVKFATSGAEAVELALKLARANDRTMTIAMRRGFHGKTLGALSATGEPLYRKPFEPLLDSFRHVAFGDVQQLREILSANPEKCCVILEPVLGEGGVVIPPRDYLSDVRALCDEFAAILIVDEVQTGLGRLGSWWGVDQSSVRPDILVCGKALSGGVVPVAAALARKKIFQPFGRDPFLHSSTFAGAPIAMAAASATIDVIEADDLVERARQIGARLLRDLTEVAKGHPLVQDVRGRGLLLGIEMAEPAHAGEFMLALLEHGVVANHSLNDDSVIRFTPPAILSPDDESFLTRAVNDSLASFEALSH